MNIYDNKQIFARNLRFQMSRIGIDRNKLAKDLDIKYPTLSDWLNAKTYPRIEKIELLANYFKIPKSALIEDRSFTEMLYRETQYETLSLIEEINYKIIPIGYSVKEQLEEGYLWVDAPGGTFPISLAEIKELNNELDSFTRFKLEELKNKNQSKE
ncbi:helix-turn-helix transcriptional regulator [Enterococcus faecalis]|uniref:helix-turn-helix domain-containing protein n=1 Tax=Enterococcus faecalis TaxID=1351 RepID=UPI00177F39D3|nr:helix-turn-helix transcriptional regulator [Enterococcus faecalis]MBD9927479.1 helix-turn-helix transcriptional regulator [Enterococcus faecalis]